MNLMKIIQSTFFSGKLVLKTWLIPILFILINCYFVYTFYLYRYETFSPPSALTTSSQLVMSGMLAYLLLGMWIVRIEESSSMSELTTLIHHGYVTLIIGKCLVGVIYIIIGQIIIFTAYLVLFYGQPIFDYFYFLSVFKYIGLFWSGSFFIAFMIGMLLGSIIRGKIIYPIILLVYCLLIPINYVFLQSFNRFFHISLDKWFNLGEPNPHSAYHALYGFSLEPVHFWKKLLMVAVILLVFMMLFIKKKVLYLNKKVILIGTVILVLFISSIIEISKDKQLLFEDSISLIDYYRKYDKNMLNEEQNIKIENVDILLTPKQNLELEVDVKIQNAGKKDLSKLFFTLFHEFEVNQIEIEGKNIDFLQAGDTVEVLLNEKLKVGQRISLTFNYEGLQTNLYFGNQQAIYLPNHFAWIPSTNLAPAFDIVSNQKGLHRISHKYMEETKYQLEINYNKKIYTNLKNQTKNKWSGSSSSGITVISGMLNEKRDDNKTYIYPISWEESMQELKQFDTYVNTVYKQVTTLLSKDNIEKPKYVSFLPTLNISDTLIGESASIDDQSIIIGTPVYAEPDRNYFKDFIDDLTYEIIPAFTTKDLPYDKSQYEFNSLFNCVYSQTLNKQMGLNDDTGFVNHFINYNLTKNEKVDSVLDGLRNWLKTDEATDSQHTFYKEWYKLVREGKSWDDLNNLLNTYNR